MLRVLCKGQVDLVDLAEGGAALAGPPVQRSISTLRLVLGDQLSPGLSALTGLESSRDVVLMAEVESEASYVRHHRQKLVLVFAAMRAHADRLRSAGVQVRYVALDDPDNAGDLASELQRAVRDLKPDRVVRTACGEWRLEQVLGTWAEAAACPVEVREDSRFLCSRQDFEAWASNRRDLTMEWFYRDMRRRTGLLMDGGQPSGGVWNLDRENRKRLPRGLRPPPRPAMAPAPHVGPVMALVAARFPDHFGDLAGFSWPTTAQQAEAGFVWFLEHGLAGFGDWQDALVEGESWLWHAAISTSLNLGLLDPMDVCRRVETAYREGRAPLNAAEGFIRQVIGWREFVRGVYWLKMPDYVRRNALGADRSLPPAYWTGETDMACLADTVRNLRENAYAHHIQRLMVTGNLAMLLGVAPAEINDWYMSVFADAFEWVELPNTHGMATFADGGIVGSKPYAASGAYIHRMGDHCATCRYDVKGRLEDNACPFNALYWDFLDRHEALLAGQGRMMMPYRNLSRMTSDMRDSIRHKAEKIRMELGARPLPAPAG